jgi:hypothetical protein
MKKRVFQWLFMLVFIGCALSPAGPLLIDDFEGKTNKETVDFGAGNDSFIDVRAAKDIVNTGEQSLMISYKVVPSGYMWTARGYGLDVKGAGQWLTQPEKIKWQKYEGFSFYIHSEKKGIILAFDVKDRDNEMWRKVFTLKDTGWHKIEIPFDKMFTRTDWQPGQAVLNEELDFPIKSYQLEVVSLGEGTLHIDTVELFTSQD